MVVVGWVMAPTILDSTSDPADHHLYTTTTTMSEQMGTNVAATQHEALAAPFLVSEAAVCLTDKDSVAVAVRKLAAERTCTVSLNGRSGHVSLPVERVCKFCSAASSARYKITGEYPMRTTVT